MNWARITLLPVLLSISAAAAMTAEVVKLVAPLRNQRPISGCSWHAWVPPAEFPNFGIGEGYIFAAEYDDSRALMNIGGTDILLKVEGRAGQLRSVGDTWQRLYTAPGVEVRAFYKVTGDCSQSNSEACEVVDYSVRFEVKKDGQTQVVQAKGQVGC